MQVLTLASASPRRRELLQLLGIPLEIIPSTVEEKTEETDPERLVEFLSRIKCLDVAEKKTATSGRAVVLGSDTIVALDGTVLGKPKDTADACRMLQCLQGRRHQVYTGVTLALVEQGAVRRTDTFYRKTEVWVSPMTEEEISAYAATGEPLDKAGAYGIQGAFARFVEKIDGDYYTVVGLPVAAVYQHLKAFL